ncbi:MAG: hypothetical protein IJU57_03085 [Clostridia bacterium]|nr:hypothetical protein [Clostridia bacterium]
MEYKTELHCHSRDGSGCSSESAPEIVKKYLDHGYSTICLTNHFTPIWDDSREAWLAQVSEKKRAYEILRSAAEGTGLNIIYGLEFRMKANFNDYLAFGFTWDYVENLDPKDMDDIGRFSNKVRPDGIYIIQAHPFRYHMTVTNPDLVDAIEVHNGHIGHESHNMMAEWFAEYHHKTKTSGTDSHDACHIPNSGIITDTEIKTAAQLIETLKSGNYKLIRELRK